MSDPMKQAWKDVEEGFSTLGRMMRDRYRGAGEGEPADDQQAGDDEAGNALREAFERLAAAGREVGDRAADVVRDDDVKSQARQAAASLNDALAATFGVVGEQVGGVFNRTKGDRSSPEVPRSEPADDDARQ